MYDKIYFIIKVIADEGLYYPYWGVLCNRRTKDYFEAKQQINLDGYWLYACVKSSSFNIMVKFDGMRIRPDAQWSNDYDHNIWYGWSLGKSLLVQGIR